MLELKKLSFAYNETDIIFKNLTKKIPYKRIGIIGSNGIGKTTLLNLIDGRDKYTGTINCSKSTFLVDFDLEKYGAFTVAEFFEMISSLKSFNSDLLYELCEKVNVNQLLDKKIKNLSKGSNKKIALLVAFASHRELLLLDEPFEAIDAASNQALMEILPRLEKELIIVSHDLGYLKCSVDKVYVMEGGKLDEL
ncbi:ABC transporter ATP-binding protein [Periweissella fabalis]|uniref:ATP-binding cassette domain-containing protein n=1 Tax=Periweissella fabalis TaxID=1070421 RepID=A0A7X6N4B9_9LACO|nr:ATP-binding cassette domain-containing protein [Periweissella fabalis]MCM0598370.1 ATP-binding cassette domain-containing protein [Periweissella fabalis]NKZ25042.1 ATP-binding cassette domain-containing protein [Periweissella fabalis]